MRIANPRKLVGQCALDSRIDFCSRVSLTCKDVRNRPAGPRASIARQRESKHGDGRRWPLGRLLPGGSLMQVSKTFSRSELNISQGIEVSQNFSPMESHLPCRIRRICIEIAVITMSTMARNRYYIVSCSSSSSAETLDLDCPGVCRSLAVDLTVQSSANALSHDGKTAAKTDDIFATKYNNKLDRSLQPGRRAEDARCR